MKLRTILSMALLGSLMGATAQTKTVLINFGNTPYQNSPAAYTETFWAGNDNTFTPSYDENNLILNLTAWTGYSPSIYGVVNDFLEESFIGDPLPADLAGGNPLLLEGSLFHTANLYDITVFIFPFTGDPLVYSFSASGIDQGNNNAAATGLWTGQLTSGDPAAADFLVQKVEFRIQGTNPIGDVTLTINNLQVAELPEPVEDVTLMDFGSDAGKQNENTYFASTFSTTNQPPVATFDADNIFITNSNSPAFNFYSYSASDDFNTNSFINEPLPEQLVAGNPLKLEGSLYQAAGAAWVGGAAIWQLNATINPVDTNLVALKYAFVKNGALDISGIDQGISNAPVTAVWVSELVGGDPSAPGFVVKSVSFGFQNATDGDVILTIDELSVQGLPEQPVTNATASVVSLSPYSSTVMEMVVSSDGPSICYPKTKTDLSNPSWSSVGHSINGLAPFIVTNLDYSAESGTNFVIYVEADSAIKYFDIGTE